MKPIRPQSQYSLIY